MRRPTITLFGLAASLGFAAEALGNVGRTTPCGYLLIESAIGSNGGGATRSRS